MAHLGLMGNIALSSRVYNKTEPDILSGSGESICSALTRRYRKQSPQRDGPTVLHMEQHILMICRMVPSPFKCITHQTSRLNEV